MGGSGLGLDPGGGSRGASLGGLGTLVVALVFFALRCPRPL